MTRSILFSATAVLLFAASACSDKSKVRPAADSDLARDLALAGAQPTQPTFQDTAMAPAPTQPARANERPLETLRARTATRPLTPSQAPKQVTSAPQPVAVANAPAPSAPVPGPARGEISGGTGFGVTSGSKVCTSSNLPGDKLVATVNTAVPGSNGAVIPAGSTVVLEVASANNGSSGDAAQLTFRVRAVVVNDKTYSVAADVTPDAALQKQKVEGTDPNAGKKKVIGGAIAGAILGRMIGHNTEGTVIGAAAGAATGAAVNKSGEKWEACLPAGSQLRITLDSPLVIG